MTFLIIAGVTLCVYALFGQAGGLVMWELLKWPLWILSFIVAFVIDEWWANLLWFPVMIAVFYPMEKMPDWMGDFLNLVVAGAFLGFGYYILTLFG